MSKTAPRPFYEDAQLGMRVECAGNPVLSEAHRVAWTMLTGDPTTRFQDSEGRVHPLTVVASLHGLLNQRFGEVATDLGIANLIVNRPVHVGTPISASARVIGARSDPDQATGVIWMQVTGLDAKGPVLTYLCWFRLPKRDARSEVPPNNLPNYPTVIEPNELPTRHIGELPQATAVNARFFFEDYEANERIPHGGSTRVAPGDAGRFARLFGFRNPRYHADLAVMPLPLVLGVGYGLTYEGFELRTGLAGINALRMPNPVHEGSRLRSWTQVVDVVPLNESMGALRLRTYVFADHKPDARKPKVTDGNKYHPYVALDLDYWEVVPTLKGARGIARGTRR